MLWYLFVAFEAVQLGSLTRDPWVISPRKNHLPRLVPKEEPQTIAPVFFFLDVLRSTADYYGISSLLRQSKLGGSFTSLDRSFTWIIAASVFQQS